GASLVLAGKGIAVDEPLVLAGTIRSASGASALLGPLSTGDASATLTADAGSTLTVYGPVSLGGAGTRLTLGGDGDGAVITPIAVDQAAAGLTKSGAGAWTLLGASGYRGPTTIEAG